MTKRGFTSAELLVALVVGAAVAGLIAFSLAGDRRTARELAEARAARAELRDAAGVIVSELRGAALGRDSLHLASDTAVDFHAPIAAGVVCAVRDAYTVVLAPRRARGGGAQSSVVATPDSTDFAWIWERDSSGVGQWRRYRVASYTADAAACDAPIAGGRGAALSFATTHGARSGSPIHLVRRGRYSTYRAADGGWYLGYRRCDATGCRVVQPVAGPFRVRAGSVWGLQFDFTDVAGGRPSDPALVAAVTVIARSDTARRAYRTRSAGGFDDTTFVAVAPRNPP